MQILIITNIEFGVVKIVSFSNMSFILIVVK